MDDLDRYIAEREERSPAFKKAMAELEPGYQEMRRRVAEEQEEKTDSQIGRSAMQAGDRVKVNGRGTGIIGTWDPFEGAFIVRLDAGGKCNAKAEDLQPVNIAVLEGKVWTRIEGTIVGETWLENALRPIQGKRVRITIEEIEEG